MVRAALQHRAGPGRHAPAQFLLAALLAGAVAAPAAAQAPRPRPTAPAPAAPAQAQPQAQAVPGQAVDQLTVDKLVWSTVAALDHANQTGNYSVLRDLGAPSFQANNSAATLGGIFEQIRNQRVDLSNALIVSPTYQGAPVLLQNGVLRAKGVFALRPTAIAFDLIFQSVAGQWRLLGISIAPVEWGRTATAPTQR
jgi:hypothetical protein